MESEGEVPHVRKKRIVEPEAPSGEPAPKIVTTAATSPTNPCIEYQMVPRHSSLVDMWNEWFALGKYEDHWGGIHGRNAGYGKKWRAHLPNRQYSRTARIIAAIEKKLIETNTPIPNCIAEMDVLFKEKKGVLSKCVESLQELGLIPKKASRGITKKN